MCRRFFDGWSMKKPYAADRLRPVRTPLRFGLIFRFRGAGNLSGVSVGATFGFPVRLHCLAVAMACPFHNDFHQTDLRIVDATARRMGRPKEKYMIDIAPFGNATAATVPLCMRACESGLKKATSRFSPHSEEAACGAPFSSSGPATEAGSRNGGSPETNRPVSRNGFTERRDGISCLRECLSLLPYSAAGLDGIPLPAKPVDDVRRPQ